MSRPADRFGVFQDDEVLAVLDNDLNLYQLIVYSVIFTIVLILNVNLLWNHRGSGLDKPMLYYKLIHIGILLMALDDMFIAVSRFQTDGEYNLFGNNKAIFYISGFNIFVIAWVLKVSHFLNLPKNMRVIINYTLFLYGIFAIWGSAFLIATFAGLVDPDTGLLGLGSIGSFIAAVLATSIVFLDILLMIYIWLKKWNKSKYQSWYALLQFLSLGILLILLLARGVGVSLIDRTKDPEQYINVEYKLIPLLSFVLPISLGLMRIVLYQPAWFNKLCRLPTS